MLERLARSQLSPRTSIFVQQREKLFKRRCLDPRARSTQPNRHAVTAHRCIHSTIPLTSLEANERKCSSRHTLDGVRSLVHLLPRLEVAGEELGLDLGREGVRVEEACAGGEKGGESTGPSQRRLLRRKGRTALEEVRAVVRLGDASNGTASEVSQLGATEQTESPARRRGKRTTRS